MSAFSFNATQVAPDPGIVTMPDGWYDLVILKAPAYEPTNDGNGKRIAAEISVADGPYKGRIVFHNFNVENSSEKAQNIGLAQLSALSHAVGNLIWTETAQLCNVVFRGRVVKEEAQNGYPEKNKMMAFKHVNDPTAGKPTNATAAPAARPTAPPPAAQTAPPPASNGWAPPPAAAPVQAAPVPTPAPAPVAAPAPTEAPAWQPTPQAWEAPAAAAPTPAPAPVAPPPVQAPPPQAAPPAAQTAPDVPPWAQ